MLYSKPPWNVAKYGLLRITNLEREKLDESQLDWLQEFNIQGNFVMGIITFAIRHSTSPAYTVLSLEVQLAIDSSIPFCMQL